MVHKTEIASGGAGIKTQDHLTLESHSIMLLEGRHIAEAEAMGLGDWLSTWVVEGNGVKTMVRSPAWAARWEKKTLTRTAGVRERSRFGFQTDMGSAKNKPEVFGKQGNFKH